MMIEYNGGASTPPDFIVVRAHAAVCNGTGEGTSLLPHAKTKPNISGSSNSYKWS